MSLIHYDLSLEWYFNDTGLASCLSVAFNIPKDIDGFVFNSSSPETIAGIDWASVDRPRNAASATINGAELSFQTAFDFLPAPFDGLGMLRKLYLHRQETILTLILVMALKVKHSAHTGSCLKMYIT